MSSLFWLLLSLLGAKDSAPSVCQPFNTTLELATLAEPIEVAPVVSHQAISLQLEPGLLQPQIEAILVRHFDVDKVYWQASPHFRWATAYQLDAANYTAALTQILQPFGLQLTLYANRSAVVSMRTEHSS